MAEIIVKSPRQPRLLAARSVIGDGGAPFPDDIVCRRSIPPAIDVRAISVASAVQEVPREIVLRLD
jgi:hypothetical protein